MRAVKNNLPTPSGDVGEPEGPRSTRAVNHTRNALTGRDRRPNKSVSTVVTTLIALLAERAR